MQKQNGISVSCGTIYSKMYNQTWYSSLDHSIAVALIIWNFTKDKKQTLAGLFHDIATPVFKHTIDFMNGDYEVQESTEELTTKIIENSQEIMSLLNRDNIKVEEIDDYHIYPIADNDTPQLAADRLEYTLSNGLGVTEKLWALEYANISKCFKIWENATKINQSDEPAKDKYCVNIDKVKVRYINPLVKIDNNKFERVDKISEKASIDIKNTLNYKTKKYAYLDFNFEKEEI